MNWRHRLAFALFLLAAGASASPVPSPGTEDIPKLMSEATLVCKGEVVTAPAPSVTLASPDSRMTATAEVRPDRCFKGTPQNGTIPVLFDGSVSAAGGTSFVLRRGDYRLFFLNPQSGKYAVVNIWFGALPISRLLGAAPEDGDPMYLLELDLKAGLRDSDPERVLDSIRMLGNMGHLHSTVQLKQRLADPDMLVKTYVWQALLRLKDYTVLPAVAEFFDSEPEAPQNLFLPRDRLLLMQFELANEIEAVRDPSTLLYLERFAVSRKSFLRMDALQALRAIGSRHSATTFLKELDDPNADNAFSAMQGLLSLAGSGAISWVPTWKQFDEAPEFYAGRCREWWYAEGQQKAAGRVASSVMQPF